VTRAVFLDRDGVINQNALEGQYVTRWEDFHILPGAVEGIVRLKQAGFCVIVVTNQRCVAKGLISGSDLEKMHQQMSDLLARSGAAIDGIYYCPHEFDESCDCRKPAPGMLLEAARSHGIELHASWMIGDSEIDVAAGRSAGCKTARLRATNESGERQGRVSARSNSADIEASSLLDAIAQILRWDGDGTRASTTQTTRLISREPR
jgi:D-glycero-D-manno-heptose 1,7-bisphosphate phosphatase